jgi:uncharacterized protein YceH (UPF0502 family)
MQLSGIGQLDSIEVRVLGALMEKEATTPEYYPLSLNALVNACNQKSNREPVVSYDEQTVVDAARRLREKSLLLLLTGSGRVNKYQQRISETLNLGRRESAVLCTLLLRGAQTLGEVKDRSERMYPFADLAETEMVLDKLVAWPAGPLVAKLPRQAGQKELRFAHLLAGAPDLESGEAGAAEPPASRIAQLEQSVEHLRLELSSLRERFEALEAQLR